MKIMGLFLMAIFQISTLLALHPRQAQETSQLPRIVELMPDFLLTLAIEPAIPKNFIALTSKDEPGWTFWGRREALEAYFKDKKSLKEPIIGIKSSHIYQTGPQTFSEDRLCQFDPGTKKARTPGF